MKVNTSISVIIRIFLWLLMLFRGVMLFIIIMVIIFEEQEVKGKFGKEYKIYSAKVPMVSCK